MKAEVKSYTDKETGLTSNQALSHKKNTLEASVSKNIYKNIKRACFYLFQYDQCRFSCLSHLYGFLSKHAFYACRYLQHDHWFDPGNSLKA